MAEGRLKVAAIACGYPLLASSQYNENHGVSRARINFSVCSVGAPAWCAAKKDTDQWICVNLSEIKTVFALETQGRNDSYDQWVTHYRVEYSVDGIEWLPVDEGKEFVGNSDKNSIVMNEFESPVRARSLRICPTQWYKHISMRLEVYFWDD